MPEPSAPGNGVARKIVEYRSVITLGNLLSILAMIVTVTGAVMWWFGDVQSRLATLATKMECAQSALNAMALKMGIELSESDGDAKTSRIH